MDLIVESFEGDIYLAYKVRGTHRQVLEDERHQPLRFNSLNQIKEYCAHEEYLTATLMHYSAYNEMCGSMDEPHEPAQIDLKWF
ncbi:DUF6482 family protein [Vibrio astriarenae]|jgi:hypothetical protein